jgi:hypothetical protein
MRSKFAAVCVLLGTALAHGQQRSITTPGLVRDFTPTKLTIETDDHRLVWFRLSDGMLASNPDVKLGDRIEVTSFTDDHERYIATWMQRIGLGSPAQATAPAAVPARVPEDSAIAGARKATAQFVAELPSFQVRRITTRYAKQGRLGRWQALDVVTSTLVYKNGLESYSGIQVGLSEFKQSIEEIDGLRSTGEFGQLLLGIFAPEAGTTFGRPRRVELRGRESLRYPFSIPREHSTWRISAPSEQYFPAYGGTLWMDRETSRILRVEMQARDLPRAFPFDSVEMNVDYSFVKLEAGDRFLLPLRNTTVFTDYIKFEAGLPNPI